ncbi:MAG: glycosyltransferase 61 family protein [Paracoccaceae bacterium]
MAGNFHGAVAERRGLPHVPDLARRLLDGAEVAGGWAGIGPVGGARLCHMRDVTWYPGTGVMVGPDGVVVPSSAAMGARAPRGRKLRLGRAAVFGGPRSYEYMLLGGVAGLGAMADLGLLAEFPAVGGPLKTWQRQVLAAAGVSALEIGAAEVHLDEVIFVSSMNRDLHLGQGLLPALVARMGERGAAGAEVVYLSQRGAAGPVLQGEAALEAALVARGVRVLQPAAMAVAEQIAAMRRARGIIGVSGAALANAIFAPEGAVVIEIRPDAVREVWVEPICTAMGLRHVAVPAKAVAGLRVAVLARLRRGYAEVSCEVGAVLAALDAVR